MFGTIDNILKEATLKIFWLIRVLMAVCIYVISGAIFLIPFLGSLETITYLNLLAWFGGTTLGLALWLVPTTIATLWMFKRIASRQGVEVEDVAFALYELKWYFNRVAYDLNFKADISKAIEEELAENKQQWMDKWFRRRS